MAAGDVDAAENKVDMTKYVFGVQEEDDDDELRHLLSELEGQFAGRDDDASASILESVRNCAKVLDAEDDAVDHPRRIETCWLCSAFERTTSVVQRC